MEQLFFVLSFLMAPHISSAAEPVTTPALQCSPANSHGTAVTPKMTEVIGGTTVMVCGFEMEQKNSEGRVFSEFYIKSVSPSGVASKAIKNGDALVNYRISKQSDALQLDEVLPLKSGWWPVFRSLVKCKNSQCSLSEEKCVFKLLATADKWYMEKLVPYFEGDQVGKVPDDTLITGAFELALTGDKKAIGFFANRPKNLKTDGASAEAYKEASSMISRLNKAHCLTQP